MRALQQEQPPQRPPNQYAVAKTECGCGCAARMSKLICAIESMNAGMQADMRALGQRVGSIESKIKDFEKCHAWVVNEINMLKGVDGGRAPPPPANSNNEDEDPGAGIPQYRRVFS